MLWNCLEIGFMFLFLFFFPLIFFGIAPDTKETLSNFFQNFYTSFGCIVLSHNNGETCWNFRFSRLVSMFWTFIKIYLLGFYKIGLELKYTQTSTTSMVEPLCDGSILRTIWDMQNGSLFSILSLAVCSFSQFSIFVVIILKICLMILKLGRKILSIMYTKKIIELTFKF